MRRFSWRFLGGLLLYVLLALATFIFNFEGLWLVFFFSSLVLLVSCLAFFLPSMTWQLAPDKLFLVEQGSLAWARLSLKSSSFGLFWQWQVRKVKGLILDKTWLYRGDKRSLQWEEVVSRRGPIYAQGLEARGLTFLLLKDYTQDLAPCQIGWGLPAFHAEVHSFANWYLKNIQEGPRTQSDSHKQVRPYQPGDPLKQVHWKLSSKQEELLVKEYEVQQPDPGPLVFLGLEGPAFEDLLSLAYSYHLSYQVPVFLLGRDHSLHDPARLEDFAKLEPLKLEDLPADLDLPGKSLVLCPCDLSPDLEARLAKAKVLDLSGWQALKETWYEA